MKVRIKRIDDSLPLPKYETEGSAGFDIFAREECLIPPKEISLIKSNLIIEVPEKYMLVIASRSSTPLKKGITPPHGFGIIDHDYCGPTDEIKVMAYNFTEKECVIKKGEKIAQGVFVRIDKFEWDEVGKDEHLNNNSRGGFGSTDITN